MKQSFRGYRKRENLVRYLPHVGIPDADNLVKYVMDAMTGVVYSNDLVLFNINAMKVYDNCNDCAGRTEILVEPEIIDLTGE